MTADDFQSKSDPPPHILAVCGSVNDLDIEQRLLNLGRQVVKFASLQRTVRDTEFMKMWEELPTW